jgi:hypothetical protein
VRTNIEWLGGVVATLGIVACSDDGQAQNGSMADDGIASLDTAGSEDGIGDLDGGGPKLDLPGGADGMDGGDEAGDQGCQKVDFLFVVDSSPSMEDEQDNLLVSFPGFISAIEDTLMVDDFHVMVIDASQTPGGGCDGTLGAGRTSNANGQDCGLVGGQRYATEEQPDLVDAFTCMASRGDEGDPNEQTMNSLLASIGPLNGAGECNEGFLRDDAVLVVTIITDEEDEGDSPGDPPLWKDVIVSAKHGDAKAIVMLGLIGDTDLPDPVCPPFTGSEGAEPSPRLRAFVESFPHGRWDSVCRPDYAPFFNAAIADIGKACTEFVPPG